MAEPAQRSAAKYKITTAEECGWFRIVRAGDHRPLAGKYFGRSAAQAGIRRLLEAEKKQADEKQAQTP